MRAAVNPDEGMWLANLVRQLNFDYLHQLGLKLSAEDIYNTENASLKDAIVQLTNGGAPSIFITLGYWGKNKVVDKAWTLISILLMGMSVLLFSYDMWVG